MYISFNCLSKAVLPLLSLLCALFYELCGLFYEAICFKVCLVLFCFCVFGPLSIGITSLGHERAYLSAFRTFDLRLFGFVCFLFLLVSGKGCGL